MAEPDAFEARFAAACRRYLDEAPTEVDAAEVARTVVTQPRARWRSWPGTPRTAPALAWLLLLAALLAALGAGALFVGSQLQPKLTAFVPPVLPAYVCPSGSTPDEAGPVDQARPAPYYGSAVAFDRRAGRLIVLVGASDVPGTVVETWTFDVCSNTWTRMHPNREPPLQVQSLVYDVDSDLTIGVNSRDWVDPPVIGNVWVYDLGANTWTEKGAAHQNPAFYDPVSGLVIAGDVAQDLWTYEVGADRWTPVGQTTPWESPGYSKFVYDASVDRLVELAGGEGAAETRLLDLRTGAWSRSGAETPVFRMARWAVPAILYDEAAKRTVVAGDFEWGTYDATADRWEILYQRDPLGTLVKPWVYDPVNRRLLVLNTSIGDIVAFDLVTRQWTVLLEPATG